jgi:leucyl aminopeptidase
MFTFKGNTSFAELQENVVVGVFDNHQELTGDLAGLDSLFEGQVQVLLTSGDIQKKYKKVSKIHTLGKNNVNRIYFVGLGKKEELTYKRIRDAFGQLVKTINQDRKEKISVLLDTFTSENYGSEQLAHSLAEAVVLAGYKFDDYKAKGSEPEKSISVVDVYSGEESAAVETGLVTGLAYGQGTNVARTLVNIPGNLLTPTDLAEQAVEIAKRNSFEYEVLEEEDMEKLGMGALLAVSKGSVEPAKLIVVKYQGRDTWDNILSFVGKGLTFDAGGYSLKPGAGMEKMKSDMGGSAAVLGAMEAIGQLKPEVNMLFVIPSSENLVNGEAMKPGDVITSMSGKTIEVTNTDAEGRLILADAVTYVKELGANYIVDLATLTGGVVVALGDVASGAITNDDELFSQVYNASYIAGEYIWQLPNFPEYRDMLKRSDVADLNNSVGRLAHPITGGLFVGEFAGDTPWVHLDIAGTAFSDKPSDIGPKGATGVMVRTLVTLARNFN